MAIAPIKQTIVYGECFTFSLRSPNSFGPPMWFSLHNGAANYPITPSPEQMELMKGFINGLHLMIPCLMCKIHLQLMIKNTDLDAVVKSREALFSFFVQAHNLVNKRLGKQIMPLHQAKRIYGFYGESGKILVQVTKTKP